MLAESCRYAYANECKLLACIMYVYYRHNAPRFYASALRVPSYNFGSRESSVSPSFALHSFPTGQGGGYEEKVQPDAARCENVCEGVGC